MTTATSTPTDDPAGTRTVQVHRVYISRSRAAGVGRAAEPGVDRPVRLRRVRASPTCGAGSPYVTTAGSGMQEYGIAGPIIDGEVIESDPPRRFVQTWRMLMDDGLKAEGFTRLTYELVETGGVTRLTVTHDLTGAPNLARPDQRRCRRPAGRRRWRLALGAQRPQVAAGDRHGLLARELTRRRGRLGTWIVPDRLRRVVAADAGDSAPTAIRKPAFLASSASHHRGTAFAEEIRHDHPGDRTRHPRRRRARRAAVRRRARDDGPARRVPRRPPRLLPGARLPDR